MFSNCVVDAQVMHMAEDCMSEKGVLEALTSCREAAKLGELLPALLKLSYKLSSSSAGAVPV